MNYLSKLKACLDFTICLLRCVGSKDVACDTPVYTIRYVAHDF